MCSSCTQQEVNSLKPEVTLHLPVYSSCHCCSLNLSHPPIPLVLFGPVTLIHCSTQLCLGLSRAFAHTCAHTLKHVHECRQAHLQPNTRRYTLNGWYTHVLDHGKVEVVSLGPVQGESVANRNHMWLALSRSLSLSLALSRSPSRALSLSL